MKKQLILMSACLVALAPAAVADTFSNHITEQNAQRLVAVAKPVGSQLTRVDYVLSAGDRAKGKSFFVRTYYRRVDPDGRAVFGNIRGTLLVEGVPADQLPFADTPVVLVFEDQGIAAGPDPAWSFLSSGRLLAKFQGLIPCQETFCEDFIQD